MKRNSKATAECQAPRFIGERSKVLVSIKGKAGDINHRRSDKGRVHELPSQDAGDRLKANKLFCIGFVNREESFAVGLVITSNYPVTGNYQ